MAFAVFAQYRVRTGEEARVANVAEHGGAHQGQAREPRLPGISRPHMVPLEDWPRAPGGLSRGWRTLSASPCDDRNGVENNRSRTCRDECDGGNEAMTHRWKRWLAPGATLTAAACWPRVVQAAVSSTSAPARAHGAAQFPPRPPASARRRAWPRPSRWSRSSRRPRQRTRCRRRTCPACPAFKGKTVYYIPLVAVHPRLRRHRGDHEGRRWPRPGSSCRSATARASRARSPRACSRPRARRRGHRPDAIPYGMAQNALDAAKAKGIPIIIADQYPPTGNTEHRRR